MLRRFLAELFVWAFQGFFLGDVKRAVRVQRVRLQLRARQRGNQELAAYKAEQETILMSAWQQHEYDRTQELDRAMQARERQQVLREEIAEKERGLKLAVAAQAAAQIRSGASEHARKAAAAAADAAASAAKARVYAEVAEHFGLRLALPETPREVALSALTVRWQKPIACVYLTSTSWVLRLADPDGELFTHAVPRFGHGGTQTESTIFALLCMLQYRERFRMSRQQLRDTYNQVSRRLVQQEADSRGVPTSEIMWEAFDVALEFHRELLQKPTSWQDNDHFPRFDMAARFPEADPQIFVQPLDEFLRRVEFNRPRRIPGPSLKLFQKKLKAEFGLTEEHCVYDLLLLRLREVLQAAVPPAFSRQYENGLTACRLAHWGDSVPAVVDEDDNDGAMQRRITLG